MILRTYPEPFRVVLIEDDDGHANLIQRNLQRAGVRNDIVHISSGTEALAYFLGGNASTQHDKTVIVLDLNLPDIDGFEILRRLKGNETTHKIPVIVLTTTDNPRDIDRCYALGGNVFLTKPVGHEDFSDAIRKLGLMLTIVQVPHSQKPD